VAFFDVFSPLQNGALGLKGSPFSGNGEKGKLYENKDVGTDPL
jgi:hypothetical protein